MCVWELKYHNSQKDPHIEESTLSMDVLRTITVATGSIYMYLMYYQIAACNLLILVPLLPTTTHTIAISMV